MSLLKLTCLIPLAIVVACSDDGARKRIDAMAPARRASGAPCAKPSSVWLLADAQLHNVAGASTRSKSAQADDLSSTAIRPASMDLWSDVVLAGIVSRMTTARAETTNCSETTERAEPTDRVVPVFHLGDAANASCIGELGRFLEVMQPLPWFGVPGNHDGFYIGNMVFRPDAVIRPASNTWQGACQHSAPAGSTRLADLERRFIEDIDGEGGLTHVAQGTLTKAHAVWMYVGNLAERAAVSEERSPWRPDNWKPICGEQCREYRLDAALEHGGHRFPVTLRAQIADLSAADPYQEISRAWQAMVVQDIALPDGVHVVLIDTTDYERTPPTSWKQALAAKRQFKDDTCRNSRVRFSIPGKCGEVGARQMAIVKETMRAWPAGTRFFLMGHHPWAALRATTARALRPLLADPGFITYVSAHTHQPASTRDVDATEPWEINIGSTSDWPMEFGRLSYWPDQRSEHGAAIRLELEYAESAGSCPYASIPEAHREADYGTTEKYVARALDAFRAILLQVRQPSGSAVATRVAVLVAAITASRKQSVDAQRALLAELIAFDRAVLQQDPAIAAVESACAIWASAVECAKEDCTARRSKALGGSERRTIEYRAGRVAPEVTP